MTDRTIAAADITPGTVIRPPSKRYWYEVVVARKGRLIVSLDLLTLGGYFAGTIDLPSDALVVVR